MMFLALTPFYGNCAHALPSFDGNCPSLPIPFLRPVLATWWQCGVVQNGVNFVLYVPSACSEVNARLRLYNIGAEIIFLQCFSHIGFEFVVESLEMV